MSDKQRHNTNNLVHGSGAAEVAVTKNEPFTGMALEASRIVQDELTELGPVGMARRDAIRLETVASMYFGLIQGCTDTETLDKYIKRWGWIQNSALRAWQYLAQLEREVNRGVSAVEVLESVKRMVEDDQSR